MAAIILDMLYFRHTLKDTEMTTTREALEQCMMAFEVDVTEKELRAYAVVVSTEDVATTFDSALCSMLDAGGIVYCAESDSFELGFE